MVDNNYFVQNQKWFIRNPLMRYSMPTMKFFCSTRQDQHTRISNDGTLVNIWHHQNGSFEKRQYTNIICLTLDKIIEVLHTLTKYVLAYNDSNEDVVKITLLNVEFEHILCVRTKKGDVIKCIIK